MKAAEARRAIATIAETQRGLVTTRQAAFIGVPRLSLSRLEGDGDLDRVTHGVYRVAGADEDEHTRTYAHWLALDPARTAAERLADKQRAIAASHRSAAQIYGIGDLPADVDTYVASYRKQTQRDGVRVRVGPLGRGDVRIEHGMLVTTPERTIADLERGEPDQSHVSNVLADALRTNLTSHAAIVARLGEDVAESLLEASGLATRALVEQIAASVIAAPAIDAIRDSLTKAALAALPDTSALMAQTAAPLRDAMDALAKAALPTALASLPWESLARASAAAGQGAGGAHDE